MKRSDAGPMTHEHDGELVVFLLGMTINRWWRPDHWLPVFTAMPRMLAELSKDPDSGLLGYRLVMDPRGPWLVQYWASVDALHRYAAAPASLHRPAWAAFNRRARSGSGAVGLWHETFVVERSESIYLDTPLSGLAAATRRVPIRRGQQTARERLG